MDEESLNLSPRRHRQVLDADGDVADAIDTYFRELAATPYVKPPKGYGPAELSRKRRVLVSRGSAASRMAIRKWTREEA